MKKPGQPKVKKSIKIMEDEPTENNLANSQDQNNEKKSNQINFQDSQKELDNNKYHNQKGSNNQLSMTSLHSEILDFNGLIRKFTSLKCSNHKVRNYDHMCTKIDCSYNQAFYCSKCLLEDEEHVLKHKEYFHSIEEYLPDRINILSGSQLQAQLDNLHIYKNEMNAYVDRKCENLEKKIEQDFEEILGTVITYCNQSKKKLLDQVKNFQKQKNSQFEVMEKQIEKFWQINENERHKIFDEFEQIITNNFDYSNFCINQFVKKVKTKVNKFSATEFQKTTREELQAIEFDLKNNQYYKSSEMEKIKKEIEKQLQNPFENNTLISFKPVQQAANQYQQQLQDIVQKNDKFTVLEKKPNHPTVAKRSSLQTTIKHPINSITFLNISYKQSENPQFNTQEDINKNQGNFFDENNIKFATASSDINNSVRLWGFTKNNITYELGSKDGEGRYKLDTENAIALNLQFLSGKNWLFCAMSNGCTFVYDINNLSIDMKKIASFTGHSKPVRCLSITEPLLFSLAHDQLINCYRLDEFQGSVQKPFTQYSVGDDCRVFDYQKSQIVVGSNKGKAQFLQYSQKQQQIEKVNEIQLSSSKITLVQVNLSGEQAYFGTQMGTTYLVNVKDQSIIHKFTNSKQAICGLNLFQTPSQIFYISIMSWDNIIYLIDSKTKSVTSDCRLQLKFMENKHFNLQGLRVMQVQKDKLFYGLCTGNDDGKVELIEYYFK